MLIGYTRVSWGRLPGLDDRHSQRLARQMATGRYTKTELASMHGAISSTVKRTLWRLGLDTIGEKHAQGMLVNGGQAAWAR